MEIMALLIDLKNNFLDNKFKNYKILPIPNSKKRIE